MPPKLVATESYSSGQNEWHREGGGNHISCQSYSSPGIFTKILEKKELFTLELISWGNTSLKLPVIITLTFPFLH